MRWWGASTGAGRSLLGRVSEDVHAIGIGICEMVCPPERGGPSSGAGRGAVGDLSAVGAPAAVAVLVFGHGGACAVRAGARARSPVISERCCRSVDGAWAVFEFVSLIPVMSRKTSCCADLAG